jgi:hypothetical protein
MCIYCGTNKYRKIYENHVGPIPEDELGRSYHVHHIDGNRKNNSPDNLVALSIQDHYDLHVRQKDWAAASFLGGLLDISEAELSKLSSQRQRALVEAGKHPWQKKGKEHPGYCHTRYVFEHLNTGEVVHLTQRELCEKFNLSIYGISQLVKKRCKSMYGWKLAGTSSLPERRVGKDHQDYDPTEYTFQNIDTGEIVTMPRCDFYKTYGLNPGSVRQLVKGKLKTTARWRLLSKA